MICLAEALRFSRHTMHQAQHPTAAGRPVSRAKHQRPQEVRPYEIRVWGSGLGDKNVIVVVWAISLMLGSCVRSPD